jgi:hypothetical protein
LTCLSSFALGENGKIVLKKKVDRAACSNKELSSSPSLNAVIESVFMLVRNPFDLILAAYENDINSQNKGGEGSPDAMANHLLAFVETNNAVININVGTASGLSGSVSTASNWKVFALNMAKWIASEWLQSGLELFAKKNPAQVAIVKYEMLVANTADEGVDTARAELFTKMMKLVSLCSAACMFFCGSY